MPLPEELQPLQLLQPRLQGDVTVPGLVGDVERELPAENRGQLDSRLLARGEPIDPGGKHLLDRLGHGDFRRAGDVVPGGPGQLL